MARMQKAAAIMQFELDGQMIARHPEWKLEHRRLLHRINYETGAMKWMASYQLPDTHFPTIDPANPYELTEDKPDAWNASGSRSWPAKSYGIMCVGWSTRRDVSSAPGTPCFSRLRSCDHNGEFLPMMVNGEVLRTRLVRRDRILRLPAV